MRMAIALMLLLPVAAHAACTKEDAERYIHSSEATWAKSVVTGDPLGPRRFLSEDFVGVSTKGEVYDKAAALAEGGHSEFVSDELDYAHIRFHGTTAVVQGSERWVKTSGASGHFVWIDTWICTKGVWQIVGAVDVNVPDAK